MLLCAPSLGVLDNWLPVLHEVRASDADWRVVAVLPDRATLAQLDPADTAHRLADDLVDLTLAPLVDGGWVVADGFLGAVELAAPSSVTRLLAPRLRGPLARLRPLLRLLRPAAQRARRAEPADVAGTRNRLLYDIQLHDKPRLAPLLEAFGETPRFSHHHGIELEQAGEARVRPPRVDLVHGVFAYGPAEVEALAANYGLDPAVVHPVGVARHEPGWVTHVIERSRTAHVLPFERFVFVVSRPAGSPYLPRERKVAALRALHQVAWEEHGLPLVLRTHPKEAEDGTLAEGLPPDEEGRSWARSRAHPFHLASGAELGVTFFSGVAVDLVALGVPVIELLDVRGLEPYDAPGAPRDEHGHPRLGPYRRDGLVLPADDVDDLRSALQNIRQDRDGAVATLSAAMAGRFTPSSGAAVSILEAVLGR